MLDNPRRLPILTTLACAIATAAAVAQYTIPSMIPDLQRAPDGLPASQCWRLVTSLLVQTLGWYQVAANLVTLAIVGAVAERMLGRGWWLALFAAGTAGGQLVAYHWRDPGGGDSIAICGLAAGVILTLLVRPEAGTRFGYRAVVCYVAALTGRGFSGFRASALACVLACLGTVMLPRRADWVALACCAISAVALVSLEKDLHGASLITGMLATAAMLAVRQIRAVRDTRPALCRSMSAGSRVVRYPAQHDAEVIPVRRQQRVVGL
jgi:membrane associated rhomboid family serine protease